MMRFRHMLLATTALIPFGTAAAIANPLNAQVTNGSANVSGTGTPTVTVTQSTDKAIINWQSFNISTGETTRFVQPGASSVTLNRVTGNLGPSAIDGTLTANGRVFLVNPDGILFGGGARINTGSFLATTNGIRDADFMAGRYQFNIPGRSDASIVNLGTITAQNGGFAALVAPGVRNSGTIKANLGTVGLAAGNNFSLDFYGDRLITLGVNDAIASKVIDVATGQPLNALISNDGKLKANGGRVELTAAAARQVIDSVINTSGVIEANSIGQKNGMIVLGAATAAGKLGGAPAQTIKISGTISAAGKRKTQKGGTIVVSGEDIQLSAAKIDASGQAGGGTVLIGGDTGGGKGNAAVVSNMKAALEPFTVATASTLSVDTATTIDASAKSHGDGGKVVLWSGQATTFYGAVKAQGGTKSGDGGFVEVSSHGRLTFDGSVNTAAPNGKSGTLLLDPQDALITTAAGPGVVTVASIQNALASGDVIVTTSVPGPDLGNITVAAPISWSTAHSLTLNADNNIAINAAISGLNGTLVLNASPLGSITATGAVTVGTFKLQSGNWIQSSLTLPTFSAQDFQISAPVGPSGGPTFLRTTGGNGTAGSPYQIADIYGLQGIGSLAVSGQIANSFVLANNIDASNTANWNDGAGFNPIGAPVFAFSPANQFVGTFDGGGHTLSNLHIASSNFDVGVFANIGNGGTVKNLSLNNVSVLGVGSGSTFRSVGVLAGESSGSIVNVSVSNSTVEIVAGIAGGLVGNNEGTISGANVVASVSSLAGVALPQVGGLAGINGGSIFQSSAGGTVVVAYGLGGGLVGFNSGTISASHSTSTVQGGSANVIGITFGSTVGGLVGQNNGVISDSYATGAVASDQGAAGGLVGANSVTFNAPVGSIFRSYATGSVSVGDQGDAGGLVGINGGSINQTFATGPVRGGANSLVGGLVGSNSVEFSPGPPPTISQSYATGTVQGGSNSVVGGLVGSNIGAVISETYAVGPVSSGPGSTVGGLVGSNAPGTNFLSITTSGIVTNSYWDQQATNQQSSAGGIGLSTSQLTAGLPSGFSNSVWTTQTGATYPYFPWQPGNTIPIPGAIPVDPSQLLASVGTLLYPFGQVAAFAPINNQVANSTPPVILVATQNTSATPATQVASKPPATNNQNTQIVAISATQSSYSVVYVNADGSKDTRQGGTVAWRDNNPGNIKYGSFAVSQGAIGEYNGFAVFPTKETGAAALNALLKSSSYQSMTVDEAIASYAPPSENNTAAYQSRVDATLGLSGSTKLSNLTQAQLSVVEGAIGTVEGWSTEVIVHVAAPKTN